MAGWMKTPLGTEVDLDAGHIVLDGFPSLRERGTAPPSFRPVSIVATVAHLSYCWALVHLLMHSFVVSYTLLTVVQMSEVCEWVVYVLRALSCTHNKHWIECNNVACIHRQLNNLTSCVGCDVTDPSFPTNAAQLSYINYLRPLQIHELCSISDQRMTFIYLFGWLGSLVIW